MGLGLTRFIGFGLRRFLGASSRSRHGVDEVSGCLLSLHFGDLQALPCFMLHRVMLAIPSSQPPLTALDFAFLLNLETPKPPN